MLFVFGGVDEYRLGVHVEVYMVWSWQVSRSEGGLREED